MIQNHCPSPSRSRSVEATVVGKESPTQKDTSPPDWEESMVEHWGKRVTSCADLFRTPELSVMDARDHPAPRAAHPASASSREYPGSSRAL